MHTWSDWRSVTIPLSTDWAAAHADAGMVAPTHEKPGMMFAETVVPGGNSTTAPSSALTPHSDEPLALKIKTTAPQPVGKGPSACSVQFNSTASSPQPAML